MTRIENGTSEETVAYLEKELNALEEDENLTKATLTSTSNNTRNPRSTGIDTSKDAQRTYCEANQ